jgi:hypothetical protein
VTGADITKIKELRKTLDRNLRVAELYSAYLSSVPTMINADMISMLTDDGAISEKEAIVAILSEAFGLDFSRSAEDRALIKDHITPSVNLLSKDKYDSDPYFVNIKPRNIKSERWEIKNETYPAYRAFVSADVKLLPDMREVFPLGYFKSDFTFPAILEDGDEWMTLTPVDTDTVTKEIADAHGKVITFGLGLGYYTYMVSNKDNVSSVTVVERDHEVIKLFCEHILPRFTNKDKVNIIEADAFEFAASQEMIREEYDYAFVDTWRDASDGAPMYLKMKKLERLHPKTEFSYWVEGFILSRIRAYNYSKIAN